jgi:RNA recognition motif-containing protein
LSQALYQQRQSASKGEDASGSESGSESDSEPEVKKPRVKTSASSDVSQQRTVFVRNLPAHTTSSGLLSHFSQYGEVRRATPVNDKQTGAFNGTAFIEFVEKASADVLLSEAKPVSQVAKGKGAHNISLTEQLSSITFDGRPLIISLAVSRSQVQALSAERDAKEDKRHGHLAREGLILAGDEGSEGLSKQDLEKRSRLWTETKGSYGLKFNHSSELKPHS